MRVLSCFLLVLAMGFHGAASAEEPKSVTPEKPDFEKIVERAGMARVKGLAWLTEHQGEDGSWGGLFSIADASFAALAYLASSEEPFSGAHAGALEKALGFLLSQQEEGLFKAQGHTWIHVQGFATLALSEAYGRSLLCKTKPDLSLAAVKKVIARAVEIIAENQSVSGGWWYTPGTPNQHEGSTTVTAVQALVSAANFGFSIDEAALARGFEYLKKCQNEDGGFDYKLGPGETSMKEGTAADVATLALMKKFDYSVMMNGYEFLLAIGPEAISAERFPYYGHFYGAMGMRLLREEFPPFADKIDGYVAGAYRDILGWQAEDGSWPLKSWVLQKRQETAAYSTAFAALLLSIPEGRLSIFNRTPPELPKREKPAKENPLAEDE